MNRILEALALPPESMVNMRVSKKMLAEQAGVAMGDRRVIQNGIESCMWIAALKPENIAVPVFKDDMREYLEIAVISLILRPGVKSTRIQELVHRAVPYPVFLVAQDDTDIILSVGHKRASLGEKNSVVLEILAQTRLQEHEDFLLTALSVARQPKKNMFAFYQGWVACVQAANIAAISGVYAPALTLKGHAEQQAALAEYERLETEIATLTALAKKEKQMPRLVALNEEISRLKHKQHEAAQRLSILH